MSCDRRGPQSYRPSVARCRGLSVQASSQINGAFGIDVGPDTTALEALARELPKTGVTAFHPARERTATVLQPG